MNTLGLLFGLFLIPAWLLQEGHGLRRRSKRLRKLFWGGVFGHSLAIPVVLAAAIFPAELWSANDTLRIVVVYWGLVIGTMIGMTLSLVRPTA